MKIVVDGMGGDNAPKAIVEGCVKAAKQIKDIEIIITGKKELIENNLPYNHTEGKRGDSKWILVDAEEVIIHIFEKNERNVYNLDLLWGDQPKINYQKYI